MWERTRLFRVFLVGLIALGAAIYAPQPEPAQGATNRFFSETGFTIDDPHFLDYFDHRGGLRSFGYPVSRQFTFNGFPVQIFQRAVMQLFPDGHVALLNLLDDGLFPYTTVNGATFPAYDPTITVHAPPVGSDGYNLSALRWIGSMTPNQWGGMPVGFYQTFVSTVSMKDVFPDGKGDSSLLTGFNLEIWGLPTSRPAFDPKNNEFVYQRFQRGILHYDQRAGVTQGVLLADYFKSILMGENLPADLAGPARSSPFFAQYNPLKPNWVDRPAQLPDTDLTRAFEPKPTIVIDPGHGGKEIGTSFTFADGSVLIEKDLTLAVANQVTAILKQAGYKVIQTRTTDSWVNADRTDVTGDGKVDLADDLQARIDIANRANASLFLSIHFNGSVKPELSGVTTFYTEVRPFSRRSHYFATLLNAETLSRLKATGYNATNRGIQTDSQAAGTGEHFYLIGPDALRPSKMPGSLVEGLFLTNAQDAARLRDPKTIAALAQAYAGAVMKYYGD